ncbi:DUF2779 domain-containing protein [Fodinibius sp. N2]|uniref:DUF2779 domain-containing protein n=1 Tax=Fodinibius alkaliphilus TaxID=3140241 RepID=UPI003159B3B7
MASFNDWSTYFTRHLFGAGLECPIKLYYYAQGYPQNQQSRPFIEHAIYNKRLLTALARSVFSDAHFVNGQKVSEAASETDQLLNEQSAVLFDAVFEHQNMMARLPIVEKSENELTLYYVRTKAFDSRKNRLLNSEGNLKSKWEKYLLDFAYQVFVARHNYPNANLRAVLVMPEKSGQSYMDDLPHLLQPFDDGRDGWEKVDESNQELLAKLDVTNIVERLLDDSSYAENYLPKSNLEDTLTFFRDLYFNKTKADSGVGIKCKRCEFRIEHERLEAGTKSGFNECWEAITGRNNASQNHIFDLIGPGTNTRLSNKNYWQTDISTATIFSPESIVKGKGRISQEMRQALQIYKSQQKEVPEEIVRPALFKELNRWQFPLHFLDFEAGNYAVPVRRSCRPYHLVVFQFSCHTLFSDGRWRHYEWIDDFKSGYPNYELIRQLQEVPYIEEGTIVQYSNFERHALKTIRGELTEDFSEVSDAGDLIFWLEKIINRHDSSHHQPPYIADLSRLVKKFYYNREMENSLSIKDVLSSVMSHSPYLKNIYTKPYSSSNFDNMIWWQADGKGGAQNPYSILTESGDSSIRRGTQAMVVYGKLIARDYCADELATYQKALLKYCELDTLAMMMIYQHWQELMK